ncbi:ATP-binding protein [Hyalangium versicolor]|uniref:ATP-binding protein n=1 Tax=Hyalangium versicolor TaxID=2861190 RepID=UPI001CCF2530|nr:serine/threonine-protein kinase [Hyalangium versicolor]
MSFSGNERSGFASLPEVSRRYLPLMLLGRGGFGTVYLARDRLDGLVAIKQLASGRYSARVSALLERSGLRRKGRDYQSVLELAHEFEILASLRHPSIISVLDHGFDTRQRPYLVLEFLEGAQTLTEAGWEEPRAVQVALLLQMLQALVYLHRRGIIHRDLKPANVLVVDGHVKLLDFGLAVSMEQRAQALRSGTRGYLAPEVLRGEPPSELSDLYSVGVIAHELFVGRRPLEPRSPRPSPDEDSPADSLEADLIWFASQWFTSAFKETEARVTREPVEIPETLEPRLARFLRGLLTLEPRERFPNAEAVIAALCEAMHQPLPAETVAARESFLQGARFVGRQREMARLNLALNEAEEETRGSAWLVGGESGVGKSRLLAEFRIVAMVRSAVVLRGQSITSGGSAYHAWRQVLRSLVLLTSLEAREAAIFRPLVPDIAELLQRDIPQPESLGPEATHLRLMATVEDVFLRLSQPTVVILEDLQWADSATLSLLERLAKSVSKARLLLLGSYRDDECPKLPGKVPSLQVLKLPRLEPTEIAALSESMMGAGGREPRVVSLLEHETEGNPFFLVEVLRALAEQNGRLDRIGRGQLPDTAFVGGMRSIIQRRLEKVPPRAREPLRLAAIIGRDIHEELLRAADPSLEVRSWLVECSDAAVLEVAGNRWRFAHDKLREGLLGSLAPKETQALHQRAAEAIESVYPNAAEWMAALAHHWGQVGDEAREGYYSEKAGDQAMSVYACSVAIPYFKRALAIAESKEEGARRLGLLEAHLAETYYLSGNMPECHAHAKRALACLGWALPRGKWGWRLGIPLQAMERLLQSAVPWAFVEKSPETRELRLEAGRLLVRLCEVLFYLQDATRLLWSGLRLINVMEPGGPSQCLARGYIVMATVLSSIPKLRPLVESWSTRAVEMAERVGTPGDVVYTLVRCVVCGIGYARWKDVEAWSERARRLADATRDFRQSEESRAVRALSLQYQGLYSRGIEVANELEERARQRDAEQTRHWGALCRAGSMVRLGRTEQALRELEEELPWFEAHAGASETVVIQGALALSLLRQGQEARALDVAGRGLALLRHMKPVAYWLHTGVTQVAEVYLTLWEQRMGATLPGRPPPVRESHEACKALRAFGHAFAFGAPFSLLCDGLEAWLSGRVRTACRAWRRCIERSKQLEMPYEEGRARLEWGRHLALADPARRPQLVRARELFAELGAVDDLRRAEAELAREGMR